MYTQIHTLARATHTRIHIYIYICVCVYVCVCVMFAIFFLNIFFIFVSFYFSFFFTERSHACFLVFVLVFVDLKDAVPNQPRRQGFYLRVFK